MGKFYTYEFYNNEELTHYHLNIENSRKLILRILTCVNGYINEYNNYPVIFLSMNLCDLVINSSSFHYNSSYTSHVGILSGYRVYYEPELKDGDFFIGYEGELNIIKRKEKIVKILNRNT